MKRKKARRSGSSFGSKLRRQFGSVIKMNPPQTGGTMTSAALAGVQPKNIVGIVPIFAGWIANNMLTKALAGKIPYTKGGIGKYALGFASSGVIGAAAGMLDKNIGKSMMIGGVVETVFGAYADVSSKGFSALTDLKGLNEDLEGLSDDLEGLQEDLDGLGYNTELSGLNDFVGPQQFSRMVPTGDPRPQFTTPQGVATVGGPTYEQRVLGDMISGDDFEM